MNATRFSPSRTVVSFAALPLIAALALAGCADQSSLSTSPDVAALFAKPGGGGPGSTTVIVTSNIADGFSIASDGLGDYRNGVGAVVSNIQAIGDWVLENDARKSTRSTRLNFTNVVSGTVPFTDKLVKGRFISKYNQLGGIYQNMTVGQTALVPLSFAFTDASTSYGLRFNPQNQPGSEYVRATCTAAISATNSSCAVWELTPSGADGTNLANLENATTNVVVAVVRMSFRITFRR